MIDSITGKVVLALPSKLILQIGAFSINIDVPLTAIGSVKAGDTVKLFTYMIIKDDKIKIAGFKDEEQREIFLAIQKTPKVGYKTALIVLSAMPNTKLIAAVESADVSALSSIPGIGKKTAERILFELKGLKATEGRDFSPAVSDAIDALISLGCDRKRSEKVVAKIFQAENGIGLETLIKRALTEL